MSHVARIYEHALTPDWGRGTLVETRDGKAVMMFEHGGRRVLVMPAFEKLKVVELPRDEAIALDAKLRGRRLSDANGEGRRKAAGAAAVSPFSTFKAQLTVFERTYPGGFTGERFSVEERGELGVKVKAKGNRSQALVLAASSLTKEKFDTLETDAMFAAVTALFQCAKLVHPLEGGLAIGTMAADLRPAFLAALRDLLHGDGEYGPRFEKFVETIKLKDTHGQPVRVSWPLATFLAAMWAPADHVCVKPTAFRQQAGLISSELSYQSAPRPDTYAQFLKVARTTHEKLVAAGQAPRDLVDTAAYIVTTHSTKPAKQTDA